METAELIAEVISLPEDQRILVVDGILESLQPADAEVDRLWTQVASRRLREIESGQSTVIPGEAVFERIAKRFGK